MFRNDTRLKAVGEGFIPSLHTEEWQPFAEGGYGCVGGTITIFGLEAPIAKPVRHLLLTVS